MTSTVLHVLGLLMKVIISILAITPSSKAYGLKSHIISFSPRIPSFSSSAFVSIPFRLNSGIQSNQMKTNTALYSSSSSTSENNSIMADKKLPRMIVFDLDGCLWRPEMYELIYFSRGQGGPFRLDPDNPKQMLTTGNEPVYLLGDVAQVMTDIYNNYRSSIIVGVSSRTDAPNWARELLQLFTIQKDEDEKTDVTLQDVIADGPLEIASDSKVQHFQRISQTCNVPLEDILFFDNESGNCKEVSKLGVTVAYCPDGVTNEIYKLAKDVFPQSDGKVIGIDVYGYDTLEGAQRLYKS